MIPERFAPHTYAVMRIVRNEMFRCHLVTLARIAFQACSFSHSDMSRCKSVRNAAVE